MVKDFSDHLVASVLVCIALFPVQLGTLIKLLIIMNVLPLA